MSRVGKLPVAIADNIKVEINNDVIKFDNGKIKKEYKLSKGVQAKLEDKELKISAIDKKTPKVSMFVGMNRSNINNIVSGMVKDFEVALEINGVGYKASVQGNLLILDLGYSHEIVYAIPENVKAVFEKPNIIKISGDDKVLVGQIAAEIIDFRKPEPYKGKGVKKVGQVILRKEGKKK